MSEKTIINWTGGGTLQTWTNGEWQILYAKDSAGNCVTLSLTSHDAVRLSYAVSPVPNEQFERLREANSAVQELSYPEARSDELRQVADVIDCGGGCGRCGSQSLDRGEFCDFVAAENLRKLAAALDLKAKIDAAAPSRPDAGGGVRGTDPYDRCPTCSLSWQLFPPTKIDNVDAVRCVECKAVYPLSTPPAAVEKEADDWRDDPSADERWNAGLDFAMGQFCAALGVDPKSVRWDAATETLDGDVNAVIWNILRARFGEDWDPAAVESNASVEAAHLLCEKDFIGAGGQSLSWKIECDVLSDADLKTIAAVCAPSLPKFCEAVGVPCGGLRLAAAMNAYADPAAKRVLIVDDVWTTGKSMTAIGASYAEWIGFVAFARGPLPSHVSSFMSISSVSVEARLREALERIRERIAELLDEKDVDDDGILGEIDVALSLEQAPNGRGNLGKGLPNVPNNAPKNENIAPNDAPAIAAFRQAQSVYRLEYDHFPLKNTWDKAGESVREGWRKIAAAACGAQKFDALKLEHAIAEALAPYFEEGFTARDGAQAVMRLLRDEALSAVGDEARFKHFAPDGGKAPIRPDAPNHLTIKTSAELAIAVADEAKKSEGGLKQQARNPAGLPDSSGDLASAGVIAGDDIKDHRRQVGSNSPSDPTAERREIVVRALRSLKEITPKGFANYHNLIDEALSGLAALDGGAGA